MSLIPWRNKTNGSRGETTAIAELRSEMDRVFDSFLRDPFGGFNEAFSGLSAARSWSPTVDMAENVDEVTVRAEIPGIDAKDLDIKVQGDQLVIAGEKKESTEKKDGGFYHVESRYGSFRRSLQLPPGTDSQNVSADYNNGVLTIRLKKTPAAKPKKIDVKVS